MANNDELIIKPKNTKETMDIKPFSIRIQEELVHDIDSISARTGHSRNELIGIFLKYAINRCKVDD